MGGEIAERLLPLKGGRNFRDFGGYPTEDGRQVRWGRLYRSGLMANLTPEDMTYLTGLGMRVICDLRNPHERAKAPSPFLDVAGVEVVAIDYPTLGRVSALATVTERDEAIRVFARAYVGFVDTLAAQYTEMFTRLARGEAPLAVNCTAGKDRTGMAAALILSVLGVPRESVVADYALTQVYTPPSFYVREIADATRASTSGLPPELTRAFATMPQEVVEVMTGSDPEVMRHALAVIDAEHDGPVNLAKSRFGLTDASIEALRAAYLI